MNELGNTPADKNYKPSGISKAEERAMEIYPDMTFPFTPLDLNAYRRGAFIQGYEQAEKDLALTWEDVRRIVVLSEDVFEEGNNLSEQEFYEEVLKRFKEIKED